MKIDFIFIGMLLINFFAFSTFSVPMAFFPKIAEIKGLGEGSIGFILGNFDFG